MALRQKNKTMEYKEIIGVDMGGTKILAGRISDGQLIRTSKRNTPAQESEDTVVNALISTIEQVFDPECDGIGIGVPSIVNVEEGIVYDVQAIPSWREVHLKYKLEKHFNRPVIINNDSNCFTIGEKYFGEASSYQNFVGLTLGTGLGAGVVINNQLYSGRNCGAGEFGAFPYKDGTLEEYCAKPFFSNLHQTEGNLVYERAVDGDKEALAIFNELGVHIGHAVKLIVLSLDPDAIFFSGSVSEAFPFFIESLKRSLEDFPYQNSLKRLVLKKSNLQNAAILGAAALIYDYRF